MSEDMTDFLDSLREGEGKWCESQPVDVAKHFWMLVGDGPDVRRDGAKWLGQLLSRISPFDRSSPDDEADGGRKAQCALCSLYTGADILNGKMRSNSHPEIWEGLTAVGESLIHRLADWVLVGSENACDEDNCLLRKCDNAPEVGALAAHVLSLIGPAAHTALPQLYEAAQLDDGTSRRAFQAACSIAKFGVAGFFYFRKLLNHANDRVRSNAQEELGELCEAALPTMEEMFHVIVGQSFEDCLRSDRDHLQSLFRRAGAFALPALANCVTDEESYTDEIRAEAAYCLGEMICAFITEKVNPILDAGDAANTVRDAKRWSLRKIRDACQEDQS